MSLHDVIRIHFDGAFPAGHAGENKNSVRAELLDDVESHAGCAGGFIDHVDSADGLNHILH